MDDDVVADDDQQDRIRHDLIAVEAQECLFLFGVVAADTAIDDADVSLQRRTQIIIA